MEKKKKEEVEVNPTISSEADEVLDTVNFEEAIDTTENKVHEEEKMNETTQTQQETVPAPRKRLTTKRVVVTTGIILGAATLITTGIVCWKKFHK